MQCIVESVVSVDEWMQYSAQAMGGEAEMTKTSTVALFVLLSLTPAAVAQDVGLVDGSFAATYQPQGPGCQGLLITGQFVAPTPDYTLTLAEVPAETTATLLAMQLTATAPGGVVSQVLTPTPVFHWDAAFASCPYGVSVAYEKQKIIIPFMPGTIARSAQ